jgi:hypothetical protein
MNAQIRTVDGSVGAAVTATIVTAKLLPNGLPTESWLHPRCIALVAVMILPSAACRPHSSRQTVEERLVGEPERVELVLAGGAPVGDKSE